MPWIRRGKADQNCRRRKPKKLPAISVGRTENLFDAVSAHLFIEESSWMSSSSAVLLLFPGLGGVPARQETFPSRRRWPASHLKRYLVSATSTKSFRGRAHLDSALVATPSRASTSARSIVFLSSRTFPATLAWKHRFWHSFGIRHMGWTPLLRQFGIGTLAYQHTSPFAQARCCLVIRLRSHHWPTEQDDWITGGLWQRSVLKLRKLASECLCSESFERRQVP